MDLNVLRGALLIALIIGFVGIFIWAWSKKRKPEFEQAARLPLEEDFSEPEMGSGSISEKGSGSISVSC